MGFPSVEVVWSQSAALPPGVRYALGTDTTLGRGGGVELSLPLDLGPRHCRIASQYGRWWVFDLGTPRGTRLNGAPVVSAELEHFDLVDLGPVLLRFLLREPIDLREPAMEAAIRARPDDAARYHVYADWLADQGSLLGERMARPRYEGSGRWLGRLASAWADGALELDWFCGVPRRAVWRRLEHEPTAGLLTLLGGEPLFRFLRVLEVDPTSLALPWHELMLQLESVTKLLPMLSQLRVGPVATVPADVRQALDSLGVPWEHHAPPAFTRLEVMSAPALVQVTPRVGRAVTLSEVGSSLVGQTDDCVVRVDAPGDHPAGLVATRFSFDGRWWVDALVRTAEGLLKVNGHEVLRACLRPGDVVEVAPGLLLRFAPP